MGAGFEEKAAAESAGPQASLGRRSGKMRPTVFTLLRKSPSSRSIPAAPAKGRRTARCFSSPAASTPRRASRSSRAGAGRSTRSPSTTASATASSSRAARALARRYRVASHRVIAIPSFGALGGSALTDRSIRVPKKALGKARIPVTYVPARNTLFLAFALGVAETSGRDGDRHRRERARLLRLPRLPARVPPRRSSASRSSGRRPAPRADASRSARRSSRMTKADIVRLALALGLDPGLTTSCYDPGKDGRPCGSCDSCLLGRRGSRRPETSDHLA